MLKTTSPIRMAFIVLLITIIWIAFEHSMGWNTVRHDTGEYARMLPAFVYWASIFILIKNIRREQGTLTFAQGRKAGILTALIYSLGFTVIIIFYQQFINPEFYPTLKAFTLAKLHAHNATQAQIDSEMKELQMSFSGSAVSYVMLFAFSFVWGVLLSAIASAIYKTKKTVSS